MGEERDAKFRKKLKSQVLNSRVTSLMEFFGARLDIDSSHNM